MTTTTRTFDLRVARALRDCLDPYHGVMIFNRAATGVFAEAGLTPWPAYFAMRSAPLGEPADSLVDAIFYHFEPGLIAASMPAVRAAGDPAKLLDLRLRAADAGLREALGEEVLGSAEMAEAAELAVTAARACPAAGRPLGAANAVLPLPDEPHLRLWQAATTLREWRGDGHTAALLASGLDAVEVLVNAVAAGVERRASIQPRRGWDDAAWEAAEHRLRDRGLLTEDGGLTLRGRELREEIEALTDRLAQAPWRALGLDASRRLYELVIPWTTAITAPLPTYPKPAAFPTA